MTPKVLSSVTLQQSDDGHWDYGQLDNVLLDTGTTGTGTTDNVLLDTGTTGTGTTDNVLLDTGGRPWR